MFLVISCRQFNWFTSIPMILSVSKQEEEEKIISVIAKKHFSPRNKGSKQLIRDSHLIPSL